MFSFSAAVRYRPFRLLIAFIALALMWPGLAAATTSEVRVGVCSSGAGGSSITITTPPSDPHETFSSSITVAGAVSHATQIDIYVNDTYSGTVPLDPEQSSYETTVSVGAGTSHIELVANDICQIDNGRAEVTVMHTTGGAGGPPQQPGEGNEPADPQGEIASGVRVNPVGEGVSPPSATSGNPVVETLEKLAVGLDLDTTARHGGPWAMIARFVAVVMGLTLLLFGPQAYAWVAAKSRGFGVVDPSHAGLNIGLRIVGAALIVAALLV